MKRTLTSWLQSKDVYYFLFIFLLSITNHFIFFNNDIIPLHDHEFSHGFLPSMINFQELKNENFVHFFKNSVYCRPYAIIGAIILYVVGPTYAIFRAINYIFLNFFFLSGIFFLAKQFFPRKITITYTLLCAFLPTTINATRSTEHFFLTSILYLWGVIFWVKANNFKNIYLSIIAITFFHFALMSSIFTIVNLSILIIYTFFYLLKNRKSDLKNLYFSIAILSLLFLFCNQDFYKKVMYFFYPSVVNTSMQIDLRNILTVWKEDIFVPVLFILSLPSILTIFSKQIYYERNHIYLRYFAFITALFILIFPLATCSEYFLHSIIETILKYLIIFIPYITLTCFSLFTVKAKENSLLFRLLSKLSFLVKYGAFGIILICFVYFTPIQEIPFIRKSTFLKNTSSYYKLLVFRKNYYFSKQLIAFMENYLKNPTSKKTTLIEVTSYNQIYRYFGMLQLQAIQNSTITVHPPITLNTDASFTKTTILPQTNYLILLNITKKDYLDKYPTPQVAINVLKKTFTNHNISFLQKFEKSSLDHIVLVFKATAKEK